METGPDLIKIGMKGSKFNNGSRRETENASGANAIKLYGSVIMALI